MYLEKISDAPILILDKALAKKTDRIGFFKVENDGFNLGAQRRPIDKNDLPEMAALIKSWLAHPQSAIDNPKCLLVPKEKIAANGDYNLSGERYRKGVVRSSRFPIVALGEIAKLIAGQSPPGESYNEKGEGIPFYQGKTEFGEVFIGEPRKWTTAPQRLAESSDVLISVRAPVGPVNLTTSQICIGRGLAAIRPIEGRLLTKYAFYLLRSLEGQITGDAGSAFASISQDDIKAIRIPLPPLEVQKAIVAEIEGYQKVIDGARAVLDNYRPHIPIDPDWPMVELGEVAEINPRKSELANLPGDTVVSFVPMVALGEHSMTFEPKETRPLSDVGASYTYFRENDVLVAKVTPCFENGKAGIARNLSNGIGFGSSEFFVIRCSDCLLPEWAYFAVASPTFRATATAKMTGTGGLQRVPRQVVEEHCIPLPPLETQRAIVAEIEAEQALVNANRELIARMEKKIQATLARVWGEDEPATAEA